ncbi:hypothetical protein KIN20_025672 [Parelaphostrongylus tenuis]|uniref:Uncharacterized protein n=1 Tax=Parelaphostrongylus tenuis TaxID=148309 RepID=A0AAD5NAY3_PARTN|nr:hypothetical protein KIN20_025672 [Parelaphostrongylus tenuis]
MDSCTFTIGIISEMLPKKFKPRPSVMEILSELDILEWTWKFSTPKSSLPFYRRELSPFITVGKKVLGT